MDITIVAWYGAALSTIGTLFQVANFLRDRRAIQVSHQNGMSMVGDPRYKGKYTIVRVVNTGRRPATITHVAEHLLDGMAAVFADTRPNLPHELTEGQHLLAIVDQKDNDTAMIEFFEAIDATGKSYRQYLAAWPTRLFWKIKRRFSSRKSP
jgi:hypothetical protein